MGAVSTGFIQMFTGLDIIGLVKILYTRSFQVKALFIAAESQALAVFIKAIGSGRHFAGGIRPSVLVISAFFEGFVSQFFVSDIVIDNGSGSVLS